jgi:septum site-determining protein MinC
MRDENFQLKGSTVTVVVLELSHYQADLFSQQLAEKIDQAPLFFQGSPVLISLEKFDPNAQQPDFIQLVAQCRELGLQPVAFKSVAAQWLDAVRDTQLAVLPQSSTRAKETPLSAPASSAPDIKVVIEEKLVQRPSKIIDRPIRSGQQVYAEGADLIVLSQVSEGAEVLADGNIHIYGALRGRALAGVRGDEQARIFCRQMEAELVSIAGNFLLSDSLDSSLKKASVQVSLQDETLSVDAL